MRLIIISTRSVSGTLNHENIMWGNKVNPNAGLWRCIAVALNGSVLSQIVRQSVSLFSDSHT